MSTSPPTEPSRSGPGSSSPLELVVLGARAGMPRAGEPSSGYLVATDREAVLLDAGPGVAGPFATALGDRELAAVLVSHLHLDHCYDLLPIAKTLLAPHVAYPTGDQPGMLTSRPRPAPCFVPDDGTERFKILGSLFPVVSSPALDRAFEYAFELTGYAPPWRARVRGFELTALPVRHAVPASGFRIEHEGRSVAFSGDTGWTESLVELADGVDVLLCEATLAEPDPGEHGHLCAAEAGRVAARANVGRLVLTHLSAHDATTVETAVRDARTSFDGPIEIARPGRRIPIGPDPRDSRQ